MYTVLLLRFSILGVPSGIEGAFSSLFCPSRPLSFCCPSVLVLVFLPFAFAVPSPSFIVPETCSPSHLAQQMVVACSKRLRKVRRPHLGANSMPTPVERCRAGWSSSLVATSSPSPLLHLLLVPSGRSLISPAGLHRSLTGRLQFGKIQQESAGAASASRVAAGSSDARRLQFSTTSAAAG